MDANMVDDRGGNFVLSKAALAQSTVTAGTLNIANNVTYVIDGVYNTVGLVNNQAFSTGHATLAAGCECIFGVWVNAAGTFSTTQGKVVDTASLSGGTGQKVVPYPDVISANALVGMVKVKTGVSATFTVGTTNLNATNITATFYDTANMPTIPLTS